MHAHNSYVLSLCNHGLVNYSVSILTPFLLLEFQLPVWKVVCCSPGDCPGIVLYASLPSKF